MYFIFSFDNNGDVFNNKIHFSKTSLAELVCFKPHEAWDQP